MKLLFAAGLAALLATPALADLMKPAGPTTIRGTITAVALPVMSVRTDDGGKANVILAPGARIAAVSLVALDAIKPNSFIGTTAAVGRDGVLRATEVHVFPEAMRGTGEGHYPWDTGKTSTMTNGNVRSMTNGTIGTVGNVKGSSGRTLTVNYKGGEKKVIVPTGIPIVELAAGPAALLVPGAHIFTRAIKGTDGRLTTTSIAVGVKGVVPPM